MNTLISKRFSYIFLVSAGMMHVDVALLYLFGLLGVRGFLPTQMASLLVQIFSFALGGIVIARTRWKYAELHMLFSIFIITASYALYFHLSGFDFYGNDYKALSILAGIAYKSTAGTLLALLSMWATKKLNADITEQS